MKNKAVLFDMDGVICHTNPFHAEAFDLFFKKRGITPSEEEYRAHMYGRSNSYILSHFLGRNIVGTELLELEDEKESLFRDIYQHEVEAIRGFKSFLNSLKTANYFTAVATSAPRANLDLIVNHLDIRNQMESLMGCEDVENHKPDPEIYLSSARNIGVQEHECIVFEDSHSGVSAAKRANMRVVGVLSTHSKSELPPCDMYIEDYENLDLFEIAKLLS